MLGLEGRVAIVTGGASGIGFATVRAFARRGTAVMIADIDEARGHRSAQLLSHECGVEVRAVAADTADERSVAQMVAATEDAFGRVDFLVNGAATFIMAGVDASPDQWERILAVNVTGYALAAKHAARAMRRSGGGAIVNICSISAYIAQPDYVTYNSTKGAVAAMTRCLALDLAPDHIRVNAVSPGTIWTESNERYIGETFGMDRARADADPTMGGRHMLGRCGDPAEVAEVITFLASDSASFMTAANVMVDGGYTAY